MIYFEIVDIDCNMHRHKNLIWTLCLQILQINSSLHDSVQGTDYIANDFFLNLKVFRTKLENDKSGETLWGNLQKICKIIVPKQTHNFCYLLIF